MRRAPTEKAPDVHAAGTARYVAPLLHLAVEGVAFLRHSAERHAECVDLVLARVADVDARDKDGRTALQKFVQDVRWRTRAFENSPAHLAVVERLCRAGASVAAEDPQGSCALSIAAANGLPRVREILFMYA